MGTEDLLLQPPERRPAGVSGAGGALLLTTGALMWVNFKKMFNKSHYSKKKKLHIQG